jgi:hypothetical protein
MEPAQSCQSNQLRSPIEPSTGYFLTGQYRVVNYQGRKHARTRAIAMLFEKGVAIHRSYNVRTTVASRYASACHLYLPGPSSKLLVEATRHLDNTHTDRYVVVYVNNYVDSYVDSS